MNLQLIRKTIGGAALLCASLIFANQALAAVPLARVIVAKSGGNYTTITAALSAISPTATAPYVIEVWPGVYTENVVLKSYVHLKGSGRNVTTVKSATGGSVITATNLTNVAISGLTLTGALGNATSCCGAGVQFRDSSGTIFENTVSNNSRGISINNSIVTPSIPPNSVIITKNNVLNNKYDGLEVWRITAVVTDNVISGNGNGGWSTGGINLNYAWNSTISGNVITANNGSGIHLFNDSTPTISNNVITDNVLVGLEYNYVNSGGTATNNKIVNNGGALLTDVVVGDRSSVYDVTVMPNISFNIFDDIGGNPSYPPSSGIIGARGVGSYNVNSNGDPILVP